MANTEGPSSFLNETAQKELQEIDQMISYVILEHDQLAKAVRAVIPNEEPHVIVLNEILEWLRIARAARIGDLRYRRDMLLPYTNQQIEEISLDEYMFETPVDMESLLRRRLDVVSSEKEKLIELPVQVSAIQIPESITETVEENHAQAPVKKMRIPDWVSISAIAAVVSLAVSILTSFFH
ncbi:MAG: hypothetical protein EBR94_01060 [Bacteroidetes bacterium]|nr:hypothetical protein [Bacteroidota bacterium]